MIIIEKAISFLLLVNCKKQEGEEMTNINRFFKLAHIVNNTRVRKNRIGTRKKNVNKNVLDIYITVLS